MRGVPWCLKVLQTVPAPEASAAPVVARVAAWLASHPEVKRLAVVGHHRRAGFVRDALVAAGIASDRLVVEDGTGASVEFRVVTPDQAGCCWEPCI